MSTRGREGSLRAGAGLSAVPKREESARRVVQEPGQLGRGDEEPRPDEASAAKGQRRAQDGRDQRERNQITDIRHQGRVGVEVTPRDAAQVHEERRADDRERDDEEEAVERASIRPAGCHEPNGS